MQVFQPQRTSHLPVQLFEAIKPLDHERILMLEISELGCWILAEWHKLVLSCYICFLMLLLPFLCPEYFLLWLCFLLYIHSDWLKIHMVAQHFNGKCFYIIYKVLPHVGICEIKCKNLYHIPFRIEIPQTNQSNCQIKFGFALYCFANLT